MDKMICKAIQQLHLPQYHGMCSLQNKAALYTNNCPGGYFSSTSTTGADVGLVRAIYVNLSLCASHLLSNSVELF